MDRGQIEVIDDAMAQVLRAKTISQRVAMVFDANRTMRKLIEAPLRSKHPDWTDQQIKQEVARRMLRGSG